VVVRAATGAAVGELTVATDPDGYQALVDMAETHGTLRAWAIEGCGGYGAGLARFLRERGDWVIELDRPQRPRRRNGARSDPLDAVRAARDALGRARLAQPRGDGQRAALAVLLAARRSAVDAARVARQQLHALVVAAPEVLRERFRHQSTVRMLNIANRLRVQPSWDIHTRSTAMALRSLAGRAAQLDREARTHEQAIVAIIRTWRPDLLEECGVGPIVAATVLCAWSHPGRFRSDAAFAMLAGASPIPASSGMTVRHRLNPHGDRQLNRALHTIVLCRLRLDPATRDYAQRRRQQGKTEREIKRCLKRYVARQLFRQLENAPTTT
jgi:transposase